MSSSSIGFSFFLVVLYMLEGLRTAFCLMCPPVPLGDFTLLFTSSGDWGTSDSLIARSLNGLPRTGCPYSIRENEYSPSLLSVYPTSYVPFLLSTASTSVARTPSCPVISARRTALPVRTSSLSLSLVVTVTVTCWPTSACLRPSPVATLVCPTAPVVSRTPRFWMERLRPSVSIWQSKWAFSCGRSGKSWQARALTRSLICFWTSRTSVALPWFRACSVKLQLLWMCSFPCSRDDNCVWSTCRGHSRKEC